MTLTEEVLKELNFKKAQKEEASKRLRKLVELKEVCKSFEKSGNVWMFERVNPIFSAVAYDIDLNSSYEKYSQIKKLIEDFEEKYNALVYLVQSTNTRDWGVQLSLFYVSQHPEEWARDNLDLQHQEAFVYVAHNNSLNDSYNEFDYIGFEKAMGGITRIY